ncbi:MAG TPA: AtpZ/AtpI family protein [Candidatus Limnocylindria bacterium]|nr:AtpZ/AtpI family protein [Candidatus Limnocylindria bacterium]
MGKAAARKTTTRSNKPGDDIQQALDTFNARQQFFTAALTMSWQLALTVVIPVVAGVKLDQKLDTSPSLTLAGFFLAAFAACTVVWNTVKGVNKLQAEEDAKGSKRKRV